MTGFVIEVKVNTNESYEQARDLMNQGEYEAAAHLFEESSKAAPHFKTLELWGECLMCLEEYAQAIIPLAAASTLNRGVRAPSLLAAAFFQLGELHDALVMAELALERDPRNKKALDIKMCVSNVLISNA